MNIYQKIIALIMVHFFLLSNTAFSGEWLQAKNISINCKTWNSSPKFGEYITWSGDCRDGYAHGEGTLTWYYNSQVDVYTGSYLNGRMNGQGKIIFSDGSIYEGSWENNNMDGQGKYTWSDGMIYDGSWENDKATGHGKVIYPSGLVIEGNVKDGLMNGYAIAEHPDGTEYIGYWKDHKLHGQGILKTADGATIARGTFEDGKFTDGTYYSGESTYRVSGGKMISHRTQKKFQQPEEKNKEDNIENVLGALLIGGAALYAISSMFSNSEENTSHSSSASSSSSSSGDDYEAIYNHNKICKGIEKACLAECESLPYNSGGVLLGKFPQSKCRSKCWNAHRECKK